MGRAHAGGIDGLLASLPSALKRAVAAARAVPIAESPKESNVMRMSHKIIEKGLHDIITSRLRGATGRSLHSFHFTGTVYSRN